jgi:predicted nucleotidyltransferase
METATSSFDTSVLDRALRERRKAGEMARRHVVREAEAALARLGEQFGFSRAYLFGSVVRPGRFGAHSDVDIAIESLADEHFFAVSAALSRALEREVDLVQLERCQFRQKIQQEGSEWRRQL